MVATEQPLFGQHLHLTRRQVFGPLQRPRTTNTIHKNPRCHPLARAPPLQLAARTAPNGTSMTSPSPPRLQPSWRTGGTRRREGLGRRGSEERPFSGGRCRMNKDGPMGRGRRRRQPQLAAHHGGCVGEMRREGLEAIPSCSLQPWWITFVFCTQYKSGCTVNRLSLPSHMARASEGP